MAIEKEISRDITPEAMRAETEFLYYAGANAQKALDDQQRPQVFEACGDTYVSVGSRYERIRPSEPERLVKPETFETWSLAGLAAYIRSDVDGMFGDETVRHIVRVTSPTLVEVLSPVIGYHKERMTVARCEAQVPRIELGRYMEPEAFQIMVQTCFQDSENRAKVLQLAGSVRKEQNMQTADDGVSQRVTVNAGVATAATVTIQNPVTLTPWRTFREVEQPESPFVLRFSEEAEAALFTGDSAGWKMRAVETIGEWLTAELAGCNVEIIA